MKGKEKCKALKEIRRQIAAQNDIAYVVEECKHKGECRGTCPKCEADVRYLERELAKKRAMGQKVALAGISLGVAASFSACTKADVVDVISYPAEIISDTVSNIFNGNDVEPLGGEPTLAGDVEYIPDDDIQGGLVEPEPLDGMPELDPDDEVDGNENDPVEDDENQVDPIDQILDDQIYDLEGGAVIEGSAPADTDINEQ